MSLVPASSPVYTYGSLESQGSNVLLEANATVQTACEHHFYKSVAIKFFGEMTADGCKKPSYCPYCAEYVTAYKDDPQPYTFQAMALTNKPTGNYSKKNKLHGASEEGCECKGCDLDCCCAFTAFSCEMLDCMCSIMECCLFLCKAAD